MPVPAVARAARGVRLATGASAGPALAARGARPRCIRAAVAVGLLAAALPIPGSLAAQQGTIAYTHSQQHDVEVPEGWGEMAGEAESATMLLLFSPSVSLMTPAAPDETQRSSVGSDRPPRARMWRWLRTRSPSRRDQEVLRDTWVSHADGAAVEKREFMGRTFLVSGAAAALDWRLTSEQAEHLGYMVIKATAEIDSTSVEAWFTPQIQVSAGPAGYGGLPGMILVLSLDGGRTQYFATEIALGEVDASLIRAPEGGDEVSREEYEAIVEEKLDELRRLYGRRGSGPG